MGGSEAGSDAGTSALLVEENPEIWVNVIARP
jgi:hypothetical protein